MTTGRSACHGTTAHGRPRKCPLVPTVSARWWPRSCPTVWLVVDPTRPVLILAASRGWGRSWGPLGGADAPERAPRRGPLEVCRGIDAHSCRVRFDRFVSGGREARGLLAPHGGPGGRRAGRRRGLPAGAAAADDRRVPAQDRGVGL